MKDWTKRILVILVLAAALSFAGAAGTAAFDHQVYAAEETEAESNDGRRLTITVVENIPAADIEENEVPLAAPQSRGGLGMAGIISIAALVVLVVFITATCLRRARIHRLFAGYENELRD